MNKNTQTIVTAVLPMAITAGLWAFTAYMKAKAFKRITGKTVKVKDAMWTALTVIALPAEEPTCCGRMSAECKMTDTAPTTV